MGLILGRPLPPFSKVLAIAMCSNGAHLSRAVQPAPLLFQGVRVERNSNQWIVGALKLQSEESGQLIDQNRAEAPAHTLNSGRGRKRAAIQDT
jgi:hypothetical protein